MKLWNKILVMLSGAAAAAMLFSGTALAAETRTKISSLTLNVASEIEAGDDSDSVEVTTSTAHCTVSEVNVLNNNGNWKVGDQPKVEVTVEADSDYYFDTIGKSRLSLKGSSAEYSSYRRKDNNSIIIFVIRLGKLDGRLELENVEWKDDVTPTARWDEDTGVKKFQVRLYRGTSAVGDTVTVSSKSYNFAGSITREGEYTFKVRAVGTNKKGDWYESDTFYVSEEDLPEIRKKAQNSSSSGSSGSSSSSESGKQTSTSTNGKDGIITPGGTNGANGSWQHDGNGWWFRFSDGGYPKGGWLQIGPAWYCFDGNGYMRTGWIHASNGNYYYCDERPGSGQGALLFNQQTPDGYWVNEKGIWVPGA